MKQIHESTMLNIFLKNAPYRDEHLGAEQGVIEYILWLEGKINNAINIVIILMMVVISFTVYSIYRG